MLSKCSILNTPSLKAKHVLYILGTFSECAVLNKCFTLSTLPACSMLCLCVHKCVVCVYVCVHFKCGGGGGGGT